MALAQSYTAQQEVLFELGPFLGVSDPLFFERPQLTPTFDERRVRGDQCSGNIAV